MNASLSRRVVSEFLGTGFLVAAVVGSGIGASHIEGFQELPNLFDIKMLCDVNRERATAVAEKYRIQEVANSFDEVSRRPDIDVLDICTPPNLHLEQIHLALKAGKHVICEKPLVASSYLQLIA